jgi:hypothetical protein
VTKPQLVMVEWLDIFSLSGWHSVKEALALEPVRCSDVGWLLHRDESRLIIFRSRNNDSGVGDVAVFPIGCVVRVTPLQKSPPVKPAVPNEPV